MITTGVALGGLIFNGQRVTGRAIDGLRTKIKEVRSDVADLRKDLHQGVAELRERIARLEGLFEGHISKGDNR